jgi:hypothetical protein
MEKNWLIKERVAILQPLGIWRGIIKQRCDIYFEQNYEVCLPHDELLGEQVDASRKPQSMMKID